MQRNNKQVLIIDNHSHVTIPIEKHIQAMDEAGIDKALLFRTLVHPENAESAKEVRQEMLTLQKILDRDSAFAQKGAEMAFRELTDAVDKYPDRFIGFGAVPLNLSVENTVKYIREEVLSRKLVGLGEFTLASKTVSLLENVFIASHSLGKLPLWIHTFNPLSLQDIQQIGYYAVRFPDVPVILGHMGGSNWLEAIEMVRKSKNIYMDTSACFSTLALKIVVREIPDRVLFGVDYPYGDMLIARQTLERVCRNEKDLVKILGGNIQKLLRIE